MNFIKRIIEACRSHNVHGKWSPRFMKYCTNCKHSERRKGVFCVLMDARGADLNPYYDCQFYKGAENNG